MGKIEKNHVFDGTNGKQPLADLFGARSRLMSYHIDFAIGEMCGDAVEVIGHQ